MTTTTIMNDYEQHIIVQLKLMNEVKTKLIDENH